MAKKFVLPFITLLIGLTVGFGAGKVKLSKASKESASTFTPQSLTAAQWGGAWSFYEINVNAAHTDAEWLATSDMETMFDNYARCGRMSHTDCAMGGMTRPQLLGAIHFIRDSHMCDAEIYLRKVQCGPISQIQHNLDSLHYR
jgi:hypothetical protein